MEPEAAVQVRLIELIPPATAANPTGATGGVSVGAEPLFKKLGGNVSQVPELVNLYSTVRHSPPVCSNIMTAIGFGTPAIKVLDTTDPAPGPHPCNPSLLKIRLVVGLPEVNGNAKTLSTPMYITLPSSNCVLKL